MRVTGAPQMTSRPISPLFSVLHFPLGLGKLQACPFPDVIFQPLPLSALSFPPFSLCLARWFWPDLINWRHVHTTSVCVSLRWSKGFHVVWLPAGSWHRLPCWWRGLCMRCVVSCSSTSFPWLKFFFAALLWWFMIHKHMGRWMWQGSALVVSLNRQKCSCFSKLVSVLSMLLLSVLFWRVSWVWNSCQL